MDLRLPRKKKSTENAEAKEGPDQAEQHPEHKTPLDLYVAKLKTLGGYSVSTVDLSSAPLAEERPRTWFLGSQHQVYDAETWGKDVLQLLEKMQQMERHTLPGIFAKYGEKELRQAHCPSSSWQDDAAYSTSLAKAIEKALPQKLGKDFKLKPPQQRPSQKFEIMKHATPWLRAQADVYEAMLEHKASAMGDDGFARRFLVGDISQSANRGSMSVDGLYGTLCTSSKLVCFHGSCASSESDSVDCAGMHLQPRGHMELLGFNSDDLQFRGLTGAEIVSLAGNAMSFTQCSAVIVPLLAHLQ